VKLHFEAFPYQRYGTCGGTLQWVSPAAVTGADRQAFVAIVALDTLTMNVAGEARPLRVGMRGEARIIVGRRALIEHVFEPLRQLRENVTVSKQSVGGPPK
jgi:membrane fusion protein